MSKIANMLNMLQILKDKKIHSISSLAEKFGSIWKNDKTI